MNDVHGNQSIKGACLSNRQTRVKKITFVDLRSVLMFERFFNHQIIYYKINIEENV